MAYWYRMTLVYMYCLAFDVICHVIPLFTPSTAGNAYSLKVYIICLDDWYLMKTRWGQSTYPLPRPGLTYVKDVILCKSSSAYCYLNFDFVSNKDVQNYNTSNKLKTCISKTKTISDIKKSETLKTSSVKYLQTCGQLHVQANI